MRRWLVQLSGLEESVTEMVTGCLRMTKLAIFLVWDLKGFLAKYEEFGTLSVNVGSKVNMCLRFGTYRITTLRPTTTVG